MKRKDMKALKGKGLENSSGAAAVTYIWLPHPHPSTRWHYPPPPTYTDFISAPSSSSSHPVSEISKASSSSSLPYLYEYAPRSRRNSVIQSCLEAFCCCWIMELCWP
ncbi:hypothetical protein SUGI_0946670 [Cryptomeria japonica]|uniref:uncharacterized protein LOC131066938 n=1 Tax=Cryptomeria japonica TaxID=3369 RepID=UPI002414C273|nr:uncharacterized protein LOC131066938 [Cryptomeria japonica]GLJ44971.1 hypothetical protein SUGI_0946670 [Cryptomeria japonica]